MSTINQHSLVVPEQVAPAFQGEILPKLNPSLFEQPKNLRGKLGRLFQKSTLITAPVLALGSAGFFMFGPTFLEFNVITAIGVIGGGTIGTGIGILGTAAAAQSLSQGDNEYTPLRPTKKYLELEVEKQKPVIQPFKDWDTVFFKHDNRTKLNQIINKKA